jgi:hypothetical protein
VRHGVGNGVARSNVPHSPGSVMRYSMHLVKRNKNS